MARERGSGNFQHLLYRTFLFLTDLAKAKEWKPKPGAATYGELAALRLTHLAVSVRAAGSPASAVVDTATPAEGIIAAFGGASAFPLATAVLCALPFFHATLHPATNQAALLHEITRQQAVARGEFEGDQALDELASAYYRSRPAPATLPEPLLHNWDRARAAGASGRTKRKAHLIRVYDKTYSAATGGRSAVGATGAADEDSGADSSESGSEGGGDSAGPGSRDDSLPRRSLTSSLALLDVLLEPGPTMPSHNAANGRPIPCIEAEAERAGIQRQPIPLRDGRTSVFPAPHASIESLLRHALRGSALTVTAVRLVTRDLHPSLKTQSDNILRGLSARLAESQTTGSTDHPVHRVGLAADLVGELSARPAFQLLCRIQNFPCLALQAAA